MRSGSLVASRRFVVPAVESATSTRFEPRSMSGGFDVRATLAGGGVGSALRGEESERKQPAAIAIMATDSTRPGTSNLNSFFGM
jgi:hypothetical protein